MRGMFPGRFQPFHHGHRGFAEQMATEVDEIVIGIGSAQASHTGRSPFTAGERLTMVHRCLSDLEDHTYVIPTEDLNRYRVWPAHVESLSPPIEALYSNNPLVRRVCKEAGLEIRVVELIDRSRFRGAEIRRRMVEGEPWREFVPDDVARVIEEIDGVSRLRRITDHPNHAVDGPQ